MQQLSTKAQNLRSGWSLGDKETIHVNTEYTDRPQIEIESLQRSDGQG